MFSHLLSLEMLILHPDLQSCADLKSHRTVYLYNGPNVSLNVPHFSNHTHILHIHSYWGNNVIMDQNKTQ